MKDIIDIKNKTIELIKEQKLLFIISTLCVCMIMVIIYLSVIQKSVKKTSSNLIMNIKPIISQQSPASKPAEIISPARITISPQRTSPTVTSTSSQANITPGQQSPTMNVPQPTKINSINQPVTTQGPPGASSQTQAQISTNPTIYPTPFGNPTDVPSSAPKIVFINSNGQSQVYTSPATPPVEITWARYTNQLEHYSIDYPSNWQIVTTQYRGHEAIFIYTPGADPSDSDVQYISYGWSTYFYPPVASYVGSFTLDGVSGTIYTNGSIGSTFIAGVFNYANGFLVLNNNISDEIFAYIFNHMILSLDFNTP